MALNSCPNDKVSDWSNLRPFSDTSTSPSQIENIMGKGENSFRTKKNIQILPLLKAIADYKVRMEKITGFDYGSIENISGKVGFKVAKGEL